MNGDDLSLADEGNRLRARGYRPLGSKSRSAFLRSGARLLTGAATFSLILLCTGPVRHVSGTALSVGAAPSVGAPKPLILIQRQRVFAGATPPPPSGCGCYEPAQFQAAYGLSSLYTSGETGTGQTIVIIDAYGSATIQGDLATFDTGFGLPAPPSFTIITPEGAIKGSNADWAAETSLDVEYAHAMAPGANILLVETPVAETEGAVGFKDIVAAENHVIGHEATLGITGGVVISQSFGATEQTFGKRFANKIAPFRTAFKAAQKAGVTVLAASGDYGVSGCTNVACTLSSHRVSILGHQRPACHQCRWVVTVDQSHEPVHGDGCSGGVE